MDERRGLGRTGGFDGLGQPGPGPGLGLDLDDVNAVGAGIGGEVDGQDLIGAELR